MSILSILDSLAATSSRLDKESILKKESNNELLKRVFRIALDPMLNFYVLKIPEYNIEAHPNKIELDAAINAIVDNLPTRKVTGHAAIQFLINILEQLSADDAVVIERIIGRDLRCGVSEKTVNRVWGKNFVQTFGVMLAGPDCKNIVYPAYAQIKIDGCRVHLTWNGHSVIAMSRQGEEIEIHNVFDATFAKLNLPAGITLDGELLCCEENGKPMERKKGNGLINKAIRGTGTKEEAQSFFATLWDIVDTSGTVPYSARFENLSSLVAKLDKSDKIALVESKVVYSPDEADEMFQKALSAGEEGLIMKNLNGKWEAKRSNSLGKMKAVESATLKIVDWIEGTGKYKDKLGAIVCESADGKLRVGVGSGFTDREREMSPDDMIGRLAEVKYNAKIANKNSPDMQSLFLPRWAGFREDKKVADTVDHLK